MAIGIWSIHGRTLRFVIHKRSVVSNRLESRLVTALAAHMLVTVSEKLNTFLTLP